MTTTFNDQNAQITKLIELLSEAQEVADQLGMSLVAIQVQEALDSCKSF